ncbi:MAG TPA: preQ(1) synthase [Rhizomicrobium sp.]|nr:preQ(1) synthase [Rhizomicrobium sp.]
MARPAEIGARLTQLGRRVGIPASPEEAALEAVPNRDPDTDYIVRFTAPEFTCLCPVTGQPDFAHFVIDYAPGKSSVESKSLKLFLSSFRNYAAFHEATTVMIGKRIADAIKPKFLRVAGYWFPRGGMPIDVFWQKGKLPSGVWLPDPGVPPYKGRW